MVNYREILRMGANPVFSKSIELTKSLAIIKFEHMVKPFKQDIPLTSNLVLTLHEFP